MNTRIQHHSLAFELDDVRRSTNLITPTKAKKSELVHGLKGNGKLIFRHVCRTSFQTKDVARNGRSLPLEGPSTKKIIPTSAPANSRENSSTSNCLILPFSCLITSFTHHFHRSTAMSVSEPLNMIKLCLDEKVYVKLRGAREIVGKLHAYDNHCNLVLGDAVETISTVDENNELKTQTKDRPMVYLRGDSVILVANASQ